ncbi:MAG: Gfo/Idh/MocA family protein [Planctomycetota bacterium]
MSRSQRSMSRRRFLKRAAAGIALFEIAPSGLFGGPNGRAPNDKLGVACIGVGNRGEASVMACKDENIVGLADVDDRLAKTAYERFPSAKKYRDFRKMLDELDRSIDAVTVGTPDHTHAVAAIEAIRRGKHVYCEKPLAHSIHEVRALMKAAREAKVVTQLGNQGHSFDSIRTFCEWIWDGAIGKVREVHAFCDAFREVYCQIDKLPQLAEKHEVPRELDYDLWLGPAAYRPYSPLWVPWSWRGWMAFGTGCLGDWVCHVVDPSFWALDLGLPTKIRAEVRDYDPKKHADVYPRGVKITYQFPAKGDRGPVKLVWFDGIERPPRPEALEEGRAMPGTGAYVYGDKGIIQHGSHGAADCRLVPEARMKEYKGPERKIPRSGDHHRDWLEAIRAGREAGSHFGYGGPLTEIGLLGAIAIRFPGEELEWDADAMRFKGPAEANALVAPPYREGWKL